MDLKLDLFRSFRSYIFDFGGGLVWLIAIAALFLSHSNITWNTANVIADLQNAEMSKSVQVMLIVAGIVIPFVANIALKPVSLLAMNCVLVVQRMYRLFVSKIGGAKTLPASGVPGWGPQLRGIVARLGEADLLLIHNAALDSLRAKLGYAKAVSQETTLVYVQKNDPALADWLDRERENVWFRSSLVVPTALLAGALVEIYTAALIWAVVAAVVTFSVAASSAARAWRAWHERLSTAVLVLTAGR